MSNLEAALSIADSGLRNVAAQLAVISNNVANAGTSGYAVETVQQSSAVAGNVGEGVFTGITVRGIDLQAQSDVLTQNGVVASYQTISNTLQPIGATQGVTGAGNDIASQLSDLQNAFETLASDPANATQQSAVVDAAGTLTGGINQLASAYVTARQATQTDIVSAVTTLNQSLDTIGQLNAQIVATKNSGESIADLQNQRDAAVQTISGLLGIKVLQENDGSIQLITDSGLSLPTPTLADTNQSPFQTAGATLLPTDTTVNGSVPGITMNGVDVTRQLTGGRIGADITLRDTTISTYQAALDEFSENLANRFGGEGLQLFTDPGGVIPSATGTPVQQNYVGFANNITVNPAVVANPALVRDGTTAIAGSATGAAAFTPNPGGGPAGFATLISNVLTYSFGADAQNGVAWPGFNATGLGENGSLAANLGAPTTLAAYATAVVASQAQDQGQASSRLDEEQAVQTTLNTQLQQSAGVDIDTELSKMLDLQNAYGANAKILTAIQQMLTELGNAIS